MPPKAYPKKESKSQLTSETSVVKGGITEVKEEKKVRKEDNASERKHIFLGKDTFEVKEEKKVRKEDNTSEKKHIFLSKDTLAEDINIAELEMLKNALYASPEVKALYMKYLILSSDLMAIKMFIGENPIDSFLGAPLIHNALIHLVGNDSNQEVVEYIINKHATILRKLQEDGESLLHRSSSMGASKITEYLLDKGWDPCARDKDKDTPLHNAILEGQIEIVKLFTKKAKGALKVGDGKGIPPLFCAAMLKEKDICTILANAGAKGIFEKKSYFSILKKAIAQNKEDEPDDKDIPVILLSKGIANYTKGVLTDEERSSSFFQAIEYLQKYIDKAPVTDPSIANCLNVLTNIYTVYPSDIFPSLKKYIFEKATLYSNHLILFRLHYYCFITEKNKNDSLAHVDWKIAYNEFKADEKNIERQLGYTKKSLLEEIAAHLANVDPQEALKYYNELEEQSEFDENRAIKKIICYITLKDKKNAVSEANKISDGDLKLLFKTFIALSFRHKLTPEMESFLSDLDNEEALKSDHNKYHIYKANKAMDFKQKKEYANAIEQFRPLLDNEESYITALYGILTSYGLSTQWLEGLEFLDAQKIIVQSKKVPQNKEVFNTLQIKSYEFGFCLRNGFYERAMILLEEINKRSADGELNSYIAQLAGQSYVHELIKLGKKGDSTELTLAEEFVNTKFLIDDESLKAKLLLYIKSAKIRTTESKKVEELVEGLDEAVIIQSELRNYSAPDSVLDAEMVEFNNNIEFFRQREELEIAHQSFEQSDNVYTWKILERVYSSSNEMVYPLESKPNYYVTISEDFLGIDDRALARYKNVLEKGIASRAKGVKGIKYVGKGVIELKMLEDIQLYTKEVYKSTDGKFLIVFNKDGNHTDIKNAAKGSKIDIITVATAPLTHEVLENKDNDEKEEKALESVNIESSHTEVGSLLLGEHGTDTVQKAVDGFLD